VQRPQPTGLLPARAILLALVGLALLTGNRAEAVPYDPLDPTMSRLELAAPPRQLGPGDDHPGMWEYVYDYYHAVGSWEKEIRLHGFEADAIANLHDVGDGNGTALHQRWDTHTAGGWPLWAGFWHKGIRPSYWSGVGADWALPGDAGCAGCVNEAYGYINEWHSPFDYNDQIFYGVEPGILSDTNGGVVGNDAVTFSTYAPGSPNQYYIEGLGLTFRVVHPNAPGIVQWTANHSLIEPVDQSITGTIVGPGPAVPEPSTLVMGGLGLLGLGFLAAKRRRTA